MLSYSLKRLLLSIPVLWLLITIVFLLSRLLPGTYGSESMYVESAGYNKGTQQQRDQAYEAYLSRTGQNLPIFYFNIGTLASPVQELQTAASEMTAPQKNYNYLIPSLQWHGTSNQYHQWFSLLLTGDLGKSYRDARPVLTILWDALSNTFWLILISMAAAFILALELSMIMVRKTQINWHKILLPGLYILDSVPLFVLSLLLLILFATPDFLQLFPVFGLGYHSYQPATWHEQFLETIPYLALPVTCLVLANLPYLTNQIYRALADTMQSNYIKTARSKGLKEGQIIRRHAWRNALLPVITILSDFLPALVAGSVVIETIFAIPGIGRLLITSVLARDFPVILGIVLMVALVKMASHLIADVCYAQADPRIRKATAS